MTDLPYESETEAINALWAAERKTRMGGVVGRRQLANVIRRCEATGMTREQITGEIGTLIDIDELLEKYPSPY